MTDDVRRLAHLLRHGRLPVDEDDLRRFVNRTLRLVRAYGELSPSERRRAPSVARVICRWSMATPVETRTVVARTLWSEAGAYPLPQDGGDGENDALLCMALVTRTARVEDTSDRVALLGLFASE